VKLRGSKDQVDIAKHTSDVERRKAANVRTALVFASIAAMFFVGIIVAHAVGGPVVGVGVMGAVVFLFVAFAIGRNLRK
jgi:hypothetical protein